MRVRIVKVLPVLLVATVAISFSSIFVRLAEAPSLVIAVYRLSLASLVVTPAGLLVARREWSALRKRDLLYLLLVGLFLALHFVFWIASLDYTTVTSAVVLVNVHPLLVGIASYLLRLERVSRWTFVGIVVSLLGGALIGYGDFAIGGNALWGDILALGGAAMWAGCLLVGRQIRQRLSLLPYISLIYPVAAAILLIFCLLTRQRFTGYSRMTYLMFILLALLPQVIGHSAFNWALGYLSAPFVGVSSLGEPVGATILAYLILKEVPTSMELMGGALILLGIYFASQGERQLIEGAPAS